MKLPLNIHLYITPYCPVPCRHCYYEALRPGAPYSGQLSAEQMASVIVALDTEYDMDVHLEGGEAFLSDDLAELLARVPTDTWQKITITTSGALKPKFDVKLLRSVGDLRVSVEGMNAEQHFTLRGMQIDRTESFMLDLQRDGVRFSIRSTLFTENVQHWMGLAQYARQLGAAQLSWYELQPVGRANQTAEHGFLTPQQIDSFLASLSAQRSSDLPLLCRFQFPERRVEAVGQRTRSLSASGWHVRSLPDIPSLTINPNGDIGVSPWKITAQHVGDRFGNVRDSGWLEKVRKAYGEGNLHDASPSTSRLRISSD
ncbi:Radical SAM domain protein [Chthoniobacter flavus Ellin428]|uniref:Radical SAM domain protein n=1 Tax=Chthoniobacter flavus Ellin428 TaxID=497964 RepID=B4CXN0_9BACT|nr:radical SAM protein [Chthoniobacter flavus]EDY21028.1 Radical SAM domain protein [Chthoniobacter flavus Ellin428]TCO88753.1 MoaA/NifB/PqqE/SkfB family radical SAM enzyme [Chthoniobacter flavus]